MKLNRRMFFQAAALLPAAGLQSKTLDDPQRAQVLTDHEADLAAPGAMAYLRDESIDLFVRLEELDPADPGDLSGAKLCIGGAGETVSVSASIGDVLQRCGYRTSHYLGYLCGEDVERLLRLNPTGGSAAFDAFLQKAAEGSFRQYCWDCQFSVYFDGDTLGIDDKESHLVADPGDGEDPPELRLHIGRHCFGVLRGELLVKFFDCLWKRTHSGDRAC